MYQHNGNPSAAECITVGEHGSAPTRRATAARRIHCWRMQSITPTALMCNQPCAYTPTASDRLLRSHAVVRRWRPPDRKEEVPCMKSSEHANGEVHVRQRRVTWVRPQAAYAHYSDAAEYFSVFRCHAFIILIFIMHRIVEPICASLFSLTRL